MQRGRLVKARRAVVAILYAVAAIESVAALVLYLTGREVPWSLPIGIVSFVVVGGLLEWAYAEPGKGSGS